jgi:hypothetical protein
VVANKETHPARKQGNPDRHPMPLDTARTAFNWLVTGPAPVSIDGHLFPGLPPHRVPLNKVRDRLLHRRCPLATRDAVWAHLVLRSRTEGATWTIGCVGVALPALTRTAARLSTRFAGDVTDIHAAVLTGFLAELAHLDLRKPRIMLRLRWAAYRAGYTAVRDALTAPLPAGTALGSAAPTPPSGHPDFVLARAVADGVLDATEAELIGATRLEGLPLATAAAARGVSYPTLHQTRRRAEHRLAAYLRDDTTTEPGCGPVPGDLATQVLDTVTITRAARDTTTPIRPSPSVTDPPGGAAEKSRGRGSKRAPESGVQGCGETPPTPATPGPAEGPSTADPGGPPMRPSEPIPQDPTSRAADPRPRRRRRDHPTRTSGRGDRARSHPSTSSSAVSEPPAPRGPGRRVHRAHLPVIAALAAGALVLGASHAHAETTQFVALAASVDQVLTNIRNWIMGILASLATVFVSVGGVRYVMAGGDPSEVDKAKTAFRAAGIGYAMAALAPLVVTVLQGIVGT